VIGSTRTGKSSFLANRVLEDAEAGKGLVLIDPTGAAAEGSLVDRVAGHLASDSFDVLDLASANFGINPLFCENPADPYAVEDVSEAVMEVFSRVFELELDVTT